MIGSMARLGLCGLIPFALACSPDYPAASSTSGAGATSSAGSGASSGSASGGIGSSTGTAAGASASASASAAGSSTGAGAGASATGTTGGPSGTSNTSSTGGIGPATSSSGGKTGTGGGTSSGGTSGGTKDGGCEPACDGKTSCCDGNCVDLTRDTTNCGMCGMPCASGDYCANSTCTPATCPQEGCADAGACCGSQCCPGEDFCCLVASTLSFFTCEEPDAGSCPPSCAPTCISRRDAKRDIQYLDEAQLQTAEDQVLRIPLARFNYKWDAPTEHRRLGFIIEDVAPSPGVVDEARGVVDLYGYTSLAVAALQEQAKEIERLRHQVDALQRRLDASAPRHSKRQ